MFVNDIVRHLLALVEDGGNGGGSGGSGGAQNDDAGSGSGGQGGSSDGGDRGGAGGGTGTGSGTQNGSDAGAGQNGQDSGTAERRIESLPQWAQQHIREIRGEAAENRTKRTAAESQMTELQRKVAEAFGIPTGDGKPDPDKLAADLTAAQQTARQRSVELAVYRAAGDKGADPATLLDSRSFLDSVADLDPNAQDFPTRLGDKIATWAQNNPRLAAGGSTTGGRPGGGIGQGGRGPQSGPTGVAAGRALHPAYKAHQNAPSTT